MIRDSVNQTRTATTMGSKEAGFLGLEGRPLIEQAQPQEWAPIELKMWGWAQDLLRFDLQARDDLIRPQ